MTVLLLCAFMLYLQGTVFAEVSIVPSDTIPLKPLQMLKEALERPDNKTTQQGGAAPKENVPDRQADNETGRQRGSLKEEFDRFNKGK